ncbi:MAG: hypothetical protein ACREQC_18730 [Candidatus Binataceae bacterium]
MEAAEKGARYAKIFRKAGALLGRSRVARAIAALEEGRALAEQLGDQGMARRFAAEIERANLLSHTAGE